MSESDDNIQGNDSFVETSESSSDEEEILDVTSDKDFFKTLSCLKKKDPSIYDKNVQFFSNSTKPETKESKPQVEKSVYVKDYVVNVFDEESCEENDEHKQMTYAEEQQASKLFFKSELENNSDDENIDSLMKVKVKTEKDKEEEEADYIQFLKGNKAELDNKEVEKDLKPLFDYWNRKDLDKNEEFLKDYILNRRYLSLESATVPNNENLSEDERELEEQAEFEDRYNRRFESEENLQIRRFPRKIDGSLRKKDDSRKRKRAEITERKKEEKDKKHKEIKKKQKEKLLEIEERLEKLKELTGNPELGFKDEEILDDFDPDKHDKRMNEFFNDDYYNQGEEEHPGFDENEYNWDYGEINMDCEANDLEERGKKLTRAKMKKLKKKKGYADIMDIAKPSFDPKVHNSFKEYFDEFYSLDCEDFIDDIPCRFKYREVVPNDYGLTIEEILMADDKELNQWASIKKICKRRPEHVEKNEVKIYSKKAHDENLKKKIFSSLYSADKDETASHEAESISYDENTLHNPSMLSKKKQSKQKTAEGNKILKGDELLQFTELERDVSKEHKSKNNKNSELFENNLQEYNECYNKRHKKRKENNIEMENNISKIGVPSQSNDLDCSSKTIEDNDTSIFNGNSSETSLENIKVKKKKKKYVENQNGILDVINDADIVTSDKNNLGNIGTNEHFIDNPKGKKRKKESNELDNTKSPYRKQKDQDQLKRPPKKKGKFGRDFKRKNKDLTELSDNRLRAYGLKPRQFRAKIKYAKKN